MTVKARQCEIAACKCEKSPPITRHFRSLFSPHLLNIEQNIACHFGPLFALCGLCGEACLRLKSPPSNPSTGRVKWAMAASRYPDSRHVTGYTLSALIL